MRIISTISSWIRTEMSSTGPVLLDLAYGLALDILSRGRINRLLMRYQEAVDLRSWDFAFAAVHITLHHDTETFEENQHVGHDFVLLYKGVVLGEDFPGRESVRHARRAPNRYLYLSLLILG